jgi:hypothetical protein
MEIADTPLTYSASLFLWESNALPLPATNYYYYYYHNYHHHHQYHRYCYYMQHTVVGVVS